MKIMIDAGHRNNQNDYGASGNGFKESSLALSISKKLQAELNKHQVIVYMSRESENNIISLEQRTSKANNLNVCLYVSIHCNAYNGQAHGIEALYYSDDSLAKDICNRMSKLTNARNRGAKQRKDLHVLKATKMDAVLVECGFIDHPQEGKLLADSNYQDKLVKAIAEAIIHKYKIVVQEQQGTPIISPATATLEQCEEWAKSKNAKQTFINNLPIYFKKCAKVGINPVVAIVQYAKETGYGKFGGVLTEDFKNPCGLKIPAGGDCKDPEAHKRFATWEDGVKAHIDHLALYAGAEGYPKSDTLDPRHFSYLKGKCKTVEALSGNWSPSSTYGNDLVKMLKEVECIKVPIKDEYQEALKVLNQEGVVNTLQAWEDKEKININHVPQLIIKCANKILELKNE